MIQLSNDNGTAAGFSSSWQGGHIIGTILTPNSTWSYPVRVDSVEFMLYRFSGAASSATVRVHVYSVVGGVPGTLLGSSAPATINTFYPNWTSISLTSANITLSSPDPFMVAIEYITGTSGSTPSTLMDSQDNITIGKNYYSLNGGVTWVEHYYFWQEPENVGYNMIRATINDMPQSPTEWKIYLPVSTKNWSPPTPSPEPPPSDWPCLYAVNWWRNDSWPYNLVYSSYSPPCLTPEAPLVFVPIYGSQGQWNGYQATIKRQGKPDFDMDVSYIFNSSGGVTGANVTKTYEGGSGQYQMTITKFCPTIGQLTGYKVKISAPPYNGQEVTVGICS